MAEPNDQSQAAEASGSSVSGSFPLSSIEIPESISDYAIWKEDMIDWLVYNNLKPFTDATQNEACKAICQRLDRNGRDLVRPHNDNPQAMLDAIEEHYKFERSRLYTELVRQLHSITIGEGGVRQYEEDFRKVNAEIAILDPSLKLPQPYVIQLFLMGLGDPYEAFVTTYIQTHVLFGADAVRFREVTESAINEERRILSSDFGVAILAFYSKKKATGKGKQSVHARGGSKQSRKICDLCKTAGRRYRHWPSRCWFKFPHLKPERFMSEEEKKKKKKKKALNNAINSERFGQTLNKMHPILLIFKLDRSFWPEIVATAKNLTLRLRSPSTRTIGTPFKASPRRKPVLSHLHTIGSISSALKGILKKLVDESEKCILLVFEVESIHRLCNLTKKKVLRANSVQLMEKRPLHVDPEEEEPEAHGSPAKRQRLSVPASASASAAEDAAKEQRITDVSAGLEDVAPIAPIAMASTAAAAPVVPTSVAVPISAKSSWTSSDYPRRDRSSWYKPDFPWPACKRFPTPGPRRATPEPRRARVDRSPSQASSTATTGSDSSSDSESPATVVELVREDPELSAIQRVLLDHPGLTTPDQRDVLPDPLQGAFAAFPFLVDHATSRTSSSRLPSSRQSRTV